MRLHSFFDKDSLNMWQLDKWMFSDVWAPEGKREVRVCGCVTAGRSKTWFAGRAFCISAWEAQLTSLSLSEDDEEEEPESYWKGESMAQIWLHTPSGSPC